MRRAARTDASQRAIVAALRKAGATVQPLHAVGAGVPDLLVGYRNRNFLIECKVKGGKLTGRQETWTHDWRGAVWLAFTPDEALRAIGAMR